MAYAETLNSTANVAPDRPQLNQVRDQIVRCIEERKAALNGLEKHAETLEMQRVIVRGELEQLHNALQALGDSPRIR